MSCWLTSIASMSEAPHPRIVLDERCGISTVATSRDQISESLERSGECAIACAAVRVIDTATLQLLVTAKRTSDKTARRQISEAPSSGLQAALQAKDKFHQGPQARMKSSAMHSMRSRR